MGMSRGDRLRVRLRIVAPPWSFFSRVGNSKLLRELSRWFVLVPIMARMLVTLTRELIQIPKLQFVSHFTLPFDWQLLYYSAFFFMLGGLVYEVRAPRIVKDFSSFFNFKRSMPSVSDLTDYFLEVGKFGKRKEEEKRVVRAIISLADDPREYISLGYHLDSVESVEHALRAAIFTGQEREIGKLVWDFCNRYRTFSRLCSCVFYSAGFVFIGLAFASDFHIVFTQSLSTHLLEHVGEIFGVE